MKNWDKKKSCIYNFGILLYSILKHDILLYIIDFYIMQLYIITYMLYILIHSIINVCSLTFALTSIRTTNLAAFS